MGHSRQLQGTHTSVTIAESGHEDAQAYMQVVDTPMIKCRSVLEGMVAILFILLFAIQRCNTITTILCIELVPKNVINSNSTFGLLRSALHLKPLEKSQY